MVLADLLDKVCRAAEGDGGGVPDLAKAIGLGEPGSPPFFLKSLLADGAQAWQAPASDASVYLFGYGEGMLRCGAAIVRPLPDITAQRVIEQLGQPERGFKSESTETLSGNVRFTRLKSAAGRFLDMMEYPALGDMPAVLRVELLPPS